jgi:1-acyl-sn-glycerol-3-phosphate acyltransferase
MNKFHRCAAIALQKIGYVVFFSLYKIFVRIEIRGRENILGLAGPIILAANHASELDPTAIPLCLPFFSKFFPIYFVSNPTEKYKTFGWRRFFYGGVFFNLLGAYPIYSGQKNYAVSLDTHIKLLRKGKTVCIFPEGKRTCDGAMNHAHGGLGYLVYATSATVVPIAIDTFFHITFWNFFLRRRKVTMTICKPMPADEFFFPIIPSAADFRAASQKVLDRIEEAIILK